MLDATDELPRDTDGHGHVGRAQLRWLDAQLAEGASAEEQVIVVVHQLLVEPLDAEGNAASWVVPSEDMVDNRHAVLDVLTRYTNVKLVLHGHVHANSLATRGGIAFVSTAAAGEYPMHWREVKVRRCELELRTRALELPALLEKSLSRESRSGRNQAKLGGTLANTLLLRTC